MNNLDLTQALKTAQQAAEAGRQVLMHYFGQLKKVEEMAHLGLVSEADIESEKVITKILKDSFPDVPVLGEEGAFLSRNEHINSRLGSWTRSMAPPIPCTAFISSASVLACNGKVIWSRG